MTQIHITKDMLRDKTMMLDIGMRIYDKIGKALKSRHGALEISAELIGELAHLADLISRSLAINDLDIFRCRIDEVRPISALFALITHLNGMRVFRMSDLELMTVSVRQIEQLVFDVWTLKALVREAYRVVVEF